MKVKIEIEMNPDEVQDLFIPSSKQKEFAETLYKAYVDAMTKTVSSTVGKIFKRSPSDSSDAQHD